MRKLEREKIIKLWFDMWLQKTNLGINNIFTNDIVYIESWGPKYTNIQTIKHWFFEWNKRAEVINWDIKYYIHNENKTIVEWHFKARLNDKKEDVEFDGISVVEWTNDNKIKKLQEFCCEINNYNPYININFNE